MDSNTHIMSFDAKQITLHWTDKLRYDKNTHLFRSYYPNGETVPTYNVYSGSIPLSMDLEQLQAIAPAEFFNVDGVQYSNCIINITFGEDVYTPDLLLDDTGQPRVNEKTGKPKHRRKRKRTLRRELYSQGFTIGDRADHYVLFKRSSSKARVGSCLFIKERYRDQMISWGRLGLDFYDRLCDIASLRAYESLTASGIIGHITLRPHEILLVDDDYSTFQYRASVTEFDNNHLITHNVDDHTFRNCLWDGEGLLDKSVYDSSPILSGHCEALLRNRWFKCCGFSTNIQQFFQDQGIGQNDYLMDMFGNRIRVGDIKLITTPSSLKLLKQAELFGMTQAQIYNRWLDSLAELDFGFGVVKVEEPSRYGDGSNVLAYQYLNSLPLSRRDIESLLSYEVDYVSRLNTDTSVFRDFISAYGVNADRELLYNLLSISDDIADTSLFRSFRTQFVGNYKRNLERGHIRIPNLEYCTIVSNPVELLYHAVGGSLQEAERPLHDNQVMCTKFGDGEELAGFRNPHVMCSNALLCINHYSADIQRYVNLTPNIVVVNQVGYPTLETLQGADCDSDVTNLTNNPVLVSAIKRIEARYSYVPVKDIASSNLRLKPTPDNLAVIDDTISNNAIGLVINLSQILNSMFYECYFSAEPDSDYMDKLYNYTSCLSSLSQVEIDRAKKQFANLDTKKVLEDISTDLQLTNEHPLFFKHIDQSREGITYRHYECPMDYVVDVISAIPTSKRQHQKYKPMSEVLIKTVRSSTTTNTKQLRAILAIVTEADKAIKQLRIADAAEDRRAAYYLMKDIDKATIDRLGKLKGVDANQIAILITDCFTDGAYHKDCSAIKGRLITYLSKAYPAQFEGAFLPSDNQITKVVRCNPIEADCHIFGEPYRHFLKLSLSPVMRA